MTTLLVEGGRALSGTVTVEGNKNAALPLLAACLLTGEPCELHNLPRIRDVEVMLQLLEGLGARVTGSGTSSVRVHCPQLTGEEPDRVLVGKLRGSVLLMGPLLARVGRVRLAPPGGDFPTRRTLSTHLDALGAFGARVVDQSPDGGFVVEAPDGLRPASMYLHEASVTATETALLAAASVAGRTEIRHAACEPHVVELCGYLEAMGARVEGAGTSTLRVEGVERRRGAVRTLWGDYIEAGSWAVVGAVTRGEIEVRGCRAADLEPVVSVMQRMRVDARLDEGRLLVRPSTPVAVRRITTGLWPSFPSDLVSLITVLATQADGRTLVHDWMYELRLFALEQMSGMNADLFLCDSHRIIVTGPRKLRGRVLDSRDLRSGMSLIAAALAAEGASRIQPLETVERGYAHLVERLRALGAQVAVEGGV
jgi:UDP-N-acetylglucosamine 1-carboxyvinyltransferase